MAQKDYVSRAKKGGQRKKTTSRKKKPTAKNSSGMWLLVIVIVAAFAGGLYFIKNNKSDSLKVPRTSSGNKQTSDTIPPTPNKRWVYVDALVNPGIHSNNNHVDDNQNAIGMSPEQQRILSMMAADRPQSTTDKSPATYNQQVDRNSQNEQKQSQTSATTETINTPAPTSPVKTQPIKTQQWLLQCGSFRNKEGAESIKAQLALAGISSQITYSDNLHRVTVGPYKSKDIASKMQTQINNTGIHSCNIRG